MDRRTVLKAGLATLGASALGVPSARAAWTPSRPVTIVVGYSPGGGTDIIARQLAASSQPFFPVPIVVLNKPGAAGTLAAQELARAAPDGYTLMMGGGSESVSVGAYRALSYDIGKDFRAVMRCTSNPQILAVAANSPIQTAQELIAKAKANPGAVSFGSSGVGSLVHATADLFAKAAGVRFKHVPYQGGGPAMQAMLAGQIDFFFSALDEVQGQLEAKTIRALAVTRPKRYGSLPDAPALKELGYDVVVDNMKGLVAPPGLPDDVYAFLLENFKKGMDNTIWQDFAKRSGFTESGYLDGPAFLASMVDLYTHFKGAARKE